MCASTALKLSVVRDVLGISTPCRFVCLLIRRYRLLQSIGKWFNDEIDIFFLGNWRKKLFDSIMLFLS